MDLVEQLIERSNQRGGRTLSVIDLLEAETFTEQQLCWLLSRIEEGNSWLVGATPGGAGKTTIMSALLAMLPATQDIRLTSSGTDWRRSVAGECVVTFEISPGRYDGYIWGKDVRTFARLGTSGCRIVGNLHADTVEEARNQIVGQCGARSKDFATFDVFLPIETDGAFFNIRRKIRRIYYSKEGAWVELPPLRASSSRELEILQFLRMCRMSGFRAIQEVRREWLKFSAIA